jgi:hypothetical protein
MEKEEKINNEIFNSRKRYFEIEKEQSDKYYSFLKHLITSSTGLITAIVIFTNINEYNLINEIFRIITILSLGLGILLSAILLYGEIKTLNQLRLNLGEHTNRLSVERNLNISFVQARKKEIYLKIEKFCFSFYGIFIISLIGFGITLNNGEKVKSIEEKLLLELKSKRTKLNDNLQKNLNDNDTLILELKHEIDSLKTIKN